jgi:hypothetical protein
MRSTIFKNVSPSHRMMTHHLKITFGEREREENKNKKKSIFILTSLQRISWTLKYHLARNAAFLGKID